MSNASSVTEKVESDQWKFDFSLDEGLNCRGPVASESQDIKSSDGGQDRNRNFSWQNRGGGNRFGGGGGGGGGQRNDRPYTRGNRRGRGNFSQGDRGGRGRRVDDDNFNSFSYDNQKRSSSYDDGGGHRRFKRASYDDQMDSRQQLPSQCDDGAHDRFQKSSYQKDQADVMPQMSHSFGQAGSDVMHGNKSSGGHNPIIAPTPVPSDIHPPAGMPPSSLNPSLQSTQSAGNLEAFKKEIAPHITRHLNHYYKRRDVIYCIQSREEFKRICQAISLRIVNCELKALGPMEMLQVTPTVVASVKRHVEGYLQECSRR